MAGRDGPAPRRRRDCERSVPPGGVGGRARLPRSTRGAVADEGVDIRGRFLIDPDGVVQAIEILSPPVGRNEAELLRQIQAFQTVRASKGGEACPAGWIPGRPTLKPSSDLVGHVWEEWKPGA